MPQQVALCVLGNGRAEVDTDAPVDQLALLGSEVLAGQAPDQPEADAGVDGIDHPGEKPGDGGQREVVGVERDRQPPLLQATQRGFDFGHRHRVEAVDPRGVGGQIGALPYGGTGQRSGSLSHGAAGRRDRSR